MNKCIHFSLPAWTNLVFDDMEKLKMTLCSMATNTKLLSRLKAGFLIREMLDHFTAKKDSTMMPDRSLWIYSAHDYTIINLLNALGLYDVSFVCLFRKMHVTL